MEIESNFNKTKEMEFFDLKVTTYDAEGDLRYQTILKSTVLPFEEGFKEYIHRVIYVGLKDKIDKRFVLVELISDTYVYNKIVKFCGQRKLIS